MDTGLLIARVVVGLVMAAHGSQKLFGWFGGSGPAAYLAPKAEQDRVAAKIWDGGRGASNWVCAALVAG